MSWRLLVARQKGKGSVCSKGQENALRTRDIWSKTYYNVSNNEYELVCVCIFCMQHTAKSNKIKPCCANEVRWKGSKRCTKDMLQWDVISGDWYLFKPQKLSCTHIIKSYFMWTFGTQWPSLGLWLVFNFLSNPWLMMFLASWGQQWHWHMTP